ncbi:MAG TPA: hypothetical protein VHS28_11475, partial [Chloroflexota bacterium]|nr:hypothetical protein [Chloroflexota bacterium]
PLVVFLKTPRSAESEGALPLALLASVGLHEAVLPGFHVATRRGNSAALWRGFVSCAGRLAIRYRLALPMLVLGVASLLGVVYLQWPKLVSSSYSLDTLPSADRLAMKWVSEHSPEKSTFLVLTTTWSWEEDSVAEWFPVLAQRRSVLTPQGSEWLPSGAFARKVCLFTRVRDIAARGKGVEELERWASEHGVAFSHIYVSGAIRGTVSWANLLASIRSSPDYSVQLDDGAVAVVRRRQPLELTPGFPGELVVGRDCQSLDNQSEEVRRAFELTYGPLANPRWVEEHEREIGNPATICSRLRQYGLVDWNCRASLSVPCRRGTSRPAELHPVAARLR